MRATNPTAKAINSKYATASANGGEVNFTSVLMNNGVDKSILGEFLSSAAKALAENIPAKDFKLFIIKNATGWNGTNFATAYWCFLNRNDILTYVPKTRTWKIGTRFAEALRDMKTLKDLHVAKKQVIASTDSYKCKIDTEESENFEEAFSIPATDADYAIRIETKKPAQTLTQVQLMQEALSGAIAEKGIESVTAMLNLFSK